MLINVVKDMLPSFDGKSPVNIWVAQLKSVAAVYELDDNMLRMLLMAKLRDGAQMWLHGNTKHLTMPMNELLELMLTTFSVKENKMALRRKFETRKWKTEGIPDEQLRRQAQMQGFAQASQVLHAFKTIKLSGNKPERWIKTAEQKSGTMAVRCFNCNSLGHFASECLKTKRERGACYGCGSMDHQISHCTENKRASHEYNVSSIRGAQ
ncbi:uncharacterized protein LOC115629977 isoform X2 [Scaptodrosophila lebanonensis]|uniref:Uncharacterized protein LOC115629977 isoform X2 n=1 Tax=Drosophila lebanonensis TaxID=7225 RepID=A0A6J2U5P0_DROLE|nr:uncharacterized protein LOC115629977 isoform X2 [Scaptodrosophila lebanonensis]